MRRQSRNLLIAAVAVTLMAAFALTPWMVRALVGRHLERLDQRYALRVEFTALRVLSRRSLALEQLTVLDHESGLRVLAETVEFSMRVQDVLRGALGITELRATGISASAADSGELIGIAGLSARFDATVRPDGSARVSELIVEQPRLDLSDPARWRRLTADAGTVLQRLVSSTMARDSGSASVAEDGSRGAAEWPQVAVLKLLPSYSRIDGATLLLSGSLQSRFELQLEHRAPHEMLRIQTSGALYNAGRPAGSWEIEKTVWYARGLFGGQTRLDAVDLALLQRTVTAPLGNSHSARIENAIVDVWLNAQPDQDTGRAAVIGRLAMGASALHLPRLADSRIELPEVAYEFSARLDVDAELPLPRLYRPLPAETMTVSARSESRGELIVERGDLQLGDLQLSVRPAVRGLRGTAELPERLELALNLPPTAVQLIIDTVPAALSGPLSEIEADGTVAWVLDFETPTELISRMQWRSDVALDGFALRSIPDAIDVFRLPGPFIHRISDPSSGFERIVRVPHSRPLSRPTVSAAHRFDAGTFGQPDPRYRYVPLSAVSPWMVRAILTAEDSDFFSHRGVNWNAVRRAVEYNLEVGEYVFGASTISMQLAKNLFLSNDRHFARKLQEFVLVVLIEEAAAVPKERLLEIYLNIIEFGPGVFGIYDAAQHYFGKHPRDLDPAEAAWLASIVPAPKQHYRQFEEGRIPDRWFSRVQQLLYGMYRRERITAEQYAAAIDSRPRFVHAADR